MFKVPFSQKSDLGQTIFANSITLTPGTISVEVEEDHFLVHALTFLPTDHEGRRCSASAADRLTGISLNSYNGACKL